MRLFRSLAVVLSFSALFSASCAKTTTPSGSSSAGALIAKSAPNTPPVRPFGRHNLNGVAGSYLNEFILPEVRSRLDEEPVGDTDGSFDPSTSGGETSSLDQSSPAEAGVENQNEDAEAQQRAGGNDESYPPGSRIDTLKFSWAKKSFGDAVKASGAGSGVIVLYADGNYYDIERLMGFVADGGSRIAESSALPGDRIQVVFGGYRSVPQVELWVLPQGSPPPVLKPDERGRTTQPEN
ncbi:MAG: hypothetical protein ABIO91_06630 [Pyrinomonadaceae bacterium]